MSSDDRLDRHLRRALAGRAASSCPDQTAFVAFHRGTLSEAESDTLREHLASCAACVELARDARVFVDAMMESADDVMPLPQARRWLAAAAILAALAFAGIWIMRNRPVAPLPVAQSETPAAAPRNPWKDLPIAAAAYATAPEDELVFRSDGPADAGFPQAMALYVRGEYAAAERSLSRFLTAHPADGRANFYRGVSLLMLERLAEAIPLLEASAETLPPVEGARFYLAVAKLKSGDPSGALPDLDAVAGAPGPHRSEAARLAEEVRNALGTRDR